MENNEKKNINSRLVQIVTALVVVIIILVVVLICVPPKSNPNETPGGNESGNNQQQEEQRGETKVTDLQANQIFNLVTQLYEEGKAPFTPYYILEAAMKHMYETEEANFIPSIDNVALAVREVFGDDVTLNSEDVSEMNIDKSIYYFNKNTNQYDVIPAGFGYIFTQQVLYKVTKDEEHYYLYNYNLNGNYEVEFKGEDGMEISKVTLILGDKNGHDLVHSFDSMTEMSDTSFWIENHKDKLPIMRYTLKQDGSNYYILEVENYIEY